MKLNTRAMAISCGLIWGGAALTLALANMIQPRYGKRFLRLVGSIYPGYHAQPNVKDAAVGTAYALLDGAIGGAVFAAVYNRILTERRLQGRSVQAA